MTNFPQTLQQAILYFANLDIATEFVKALRWPSGVTCPHCQSTAYSYISTRRIWKCKTCRKQYSVKVGTIFEDSPLGLDKWLPAVWLIANAKNGISSCEIARSLGVTQKTAWFMLHRIRLAMQNGSFEKMSGEVEADETYIGGKAGNMHEWKRETRRDKAIVFGLLERHGGRVKTKVIENTKKETLEKAIGENVERGAMVYTDEFPSYRNIEPDFGHMVINHAERYVSGRVHTNGIENFWSLFDRSMLGTYTHCESFHLFRYLDEQSFRFNERKTNDAVRFVKVISAVNSKRITYAKLTNNETKKPLRQLRMF